MEIDDILSVGPTHRIDADGRPEFAVVCSDRVEKFVAYDNDDLEDWIRVLSPKKRSQGTDGEIDDGTEVLFG